MKKPFACGIDGCKKSFVDLRARHQHRCSKHWKKSKKSNCETRMDCYPMHVMNRNDKYDSVDVLGLPDGAHWAMIEEMFNLEPSDFA